MLGSHSQSTQSSTERSRPRSRLLVMKERLRLQRHHQQQNSGRCQSSEAKQYSSSATSESCPSGSSVLTQPPSAVQSPIKGRRFQRSRHAEQQARSRSQDTVTTAMKRDGFLGCTGETRLLQKSKSVELNLEKIVEATGSNSQSEVEKPAAAGSQKVEKKGSFLFRSSSLLARLSGRSGQKKLQSPSPLRHAGSQSASTDNPDDSIGAGINQSVTSSSSSKAASLSETACLEALTSHSAEVERNECVSQAFVVTSQLSQTQQAAKGSLQSTDNSRACQCSTFVKNPRIPSSCPPHADSKCHGKAGALEQGSEIVLAAEMRRGLPRQMSEDWMTFHTHTEDDCSRPPLAYHGQTKTAKKQTGGRRRVSISAGNLQNRMPQVREDSSDSAIANASTSATRNPTDPASLDAVAMTTTSHEQHCEYYNVDLSWPL